MNKENGQYHLETEVEGIKRRLDVMEKYELNSKSDHHVLDEATRQILFRVNGEERTLVNIALNKETVDAYLRENLDSDQLKDLSDLFVKEVEESVHAALCRAYLECKKDKWVVETITSIDICKQSVEKRLDTEFSAEQWEDMMDVLKEQLEGHISGIIGEVYEKCAVEKWMSSEKCDACFQPLDGGGYGVTGFKGEYHKRCKPPERNARDGEPTVS